MLVKYFVDISIPLWFDWEVVILFSCSYRFVNFNSTMVRLGVSCSGRNDISDKISIPLWFDWEFAVIIKSLGLWPISIPLWFDWECIKHKPTTFLRAISIPLWFDWEELQN